MEAGKITIRDIFSRGRNLEIPFFQRTYVWDTEQWQRFLEDMRMVSIKKRPYFLGSVILKQKQTTTGDGDIRIVIDGQQRLTTLNIFLKILCLKKGINDKFIGTFTKDKDDSIILLHNHNDQKSFNEVVNLTTLEDFKTISENDKIFAAYNFFNENITEGDLSNSLDFFNILDRILFVGIELGHEEDEQQIFDTINSLGVRLTTAELLKNHFFSNNELKEYEENWKNVFENEDNKDYWDREIITGRLKRVVIDLFFYSYLQIKIHDPALKVESKHKKEFSRVEGLFGTYKFFFNQYIGKGKKISFLQEIKSYAETFQKNFDPDVINQNLTHESGIERITTIIYQLDVSTLIPYVLYILKNVENNSDQMKELFQVIESYIMRRMVRRLTTKNYNNFFISLISNRILSKQEFIEHLKKQSDTDDLFNDEVLKKAFHESHLINKQSAGIIYLIESKLNATKYGTQPLGINKYSLEHLMPKKWGQYWAEVDNPDNRNFKLLTLGNLAIITQPLNSAIKNYAWKTKTEHLKKYSAGIRTLTDYLDCEEWNEATIEERADFLYEKAKEIWKL